MRCAALVIVAITWVALVVLGVRKRLRQHCGQQVSDGNQTNHNGGL